MVGWQTGPESQGGEVSGFPALALVGILVGFACAIAIYFRPMWAKFLGPVYAVGEGFFLGVISKAYEGTSTASSFRPSVPPSACSQ